MIAGLEAAPSAATVGAAPRVVEVDDLRIAFVTRKRRLEAIRGVGFTLAPGETLCLLGESGSGKSLTLRSLLRLLPSHAEVSGTIKVDGLDVLTLGAAELRRLRGRLVSMVFQEPATALDPTFTIGRQIVEAVQAHESMSDAQARRRALELLDLVQIPSAARRLDAYSHELSGGLRQRAMIALALSCRPKFLLADEPTTALDATVQIQVLLLLRRLQRELGMAMLFVTHDIGIACEIADRVAVMYAGKIVETGPIERIIDAPAHPYTRGLLRSVALPESSDTRLEPIPGAPPDIAAMPPGCAFGPRCDFFQNQCREREPSLVNIEPARQTRCLLLEKATPAEAFGGVEGKGRLA